MLSIQTDLIYYMKIDKWLIKYVNVDLIHDLIVSDSRFQIFHT